MSKRIRLVVLLLLMGHVLFLPLLPLLAAEAKAETRITITIAASGAAFGVYFFLRLAFQTSSLISENPDDGNALFDFGPQGWQTKFPSLNIIRDDYPKMLHPGGAANETTQLEILKLRF